MDTTMTTRTAYAPAFEPASEPAFVTGFVSGSTLVASACRGLGLGARRPLDRSSCLLR